jgi:hypothetical protein
MLALERRLWLALRSFPRRLVQARFPPEAEVPRVDVPLPRTRAEVPCSELIKDLPTLRGMVRLSRAT